MELTPSVQLTALLAKPIGPTSFESSFSQLQNEQSFDLIGSQ